MSKRDTYHEVVKQALIREGWTITHDPYSFDAAPQLSTDLGAERLLAAERQTDPENHCNGIPDNILPTIYQSLID